MTLMMIIIIIIIIITMITTIITNTSLLPIDGPHCITAPLADSLCACTSQY
jgi:hypothetical protein